MQSCAVLGVFHHKRSLPKNPTEVLVPKLSASEPAYAGTPLSICQNIIR